MSDRLSRLAPLTGALFAVLAVVAIFTGGESPGTNEPPAKIVAYYASHESEVGHWEGVSAWLSGIRSGWVGVARVRFAESGTGWGQTLEIRGLRGRCSCGRPKMIERYGRNDLGEASQAWADGEP